MITPNPSVFALVGPTASGKSSVAHYLAEQTGSPVISADSMNIYRGMDIGTAKPSLNQRAAVQYVGIDLADPTQSFSVGDWLNAIKLGFQCTGNNPTPIVAGGTGLYVKCLLAGLDPLPPADEVLRARAEKMSLAELQAEARSVAPEAYAELADTENPRRLIRLLEHGTVPGNQKKELPVVMGLHVEREVLLKRIAQRVDEMYASGLLDEAKRLIDLNLSVTAQKAIGYAEAFSVLRGEITENQAKELTLIRTRQLAKRQMTWFRSQLNVKWVDTRSFPTVEKLAAEVSRVWERIPVVL